MTSCHGSIDSYMANLTSSYADQSNEASMVSASIMILLLAGIFFNINLFRSFSVLSAVLNPKVRLILSSGLSIFLPVMSYIFSEAKNSDLEFSRLLALRLKPDLPLRAGLILAWMLLVELLRENVEEIRMRGYATSGIIQRAGRVVWLGSLVFFNIRSAGRKAVFGGLWILCASKLVQRVAFSGAGKKSYLHNKNAKLIASYMWQVVRKDRRQLGVESANHVELGVEPESVQAAESSPHVQVAAVDGRSELLKRCEYIVMGEEELVKEVTADGYELEKIAPGDSVVTVGKVWAELSNRDQLFTAYDGDERLKRLCLSFALFKLLRRRFEQVGEITEEEALDCRELIFKGVCNNGGATPDEAEAVFQVMNNEVNFLREYYHSVVPVVLASPFFLLCNYILLPVVLFGLWLMTIVLCGNGDLRYAFGSIATDNYTLSYGITDLICLLRIVTRSAQAFFSLVDLSISILLFLIFLYEEVWEFLVFVLSNWFVISLLRNYIAKPKWRGSSLFIGAFRWILWLRSMMSPGKLRFNQFSALGPRWPLILAVPAMLSLRIRLVAVPDEVKHSIVKYLVAHESAGATLSNGMSALEKHTETFPGLSWACKSESTAEVILTWHIATSLLEVKCPLRGGERAFSRVATSLSKYCAYLVAFHPELLPDNQDKAERVFKAMKEELRSSLGFVHHCFSGRHARANKILETAEEKEECWSEKKVVKNGATLANMLIKQARENGRQKAVWDVLADVWTELMVYVAPSNDERQVKGHESLLVQGHEFVTVLWALTTHTSISRPASKPTDE